MMQQITNDIQRALINMIRIGVVVKVDGMKARCRVLLDGLESAWLPWCADAGLVSVWRAPSVDEQVIVIAPAGDMSRAVVIGSLFSEANPQPATEAKRLHRIAYNDGATVDYDQYVHDLRINLPAGATMTVIANGGVTIRGDVSIEGSLHTTGDTVAGNISLQQHTHRGVQAGGANTGVPQ
jgi:phage baseplate assembly protein V